MAMELLSYLENWRQVIERLSNATTYLYISLYLPDEPIGFVKSFDDLRAALAQHWDIETDLLLNSQHVLILARSKLARTKLDAVHF